MKRVCTAYARQIATSGLFCMPGVRSAAATAAAAASSVCHGVTAHLETCAVRSAKCSLPGSTARGATVSLRLSGRTKPTPQGTIVSKCCELHLGPACAWTSIDSLQLCDITADNVPGWPPRRSEGRPVALHLQHRMECRVRCSHVECMDHNRSNVK
jgi:hypothetical protein